MLGERGLVDLMVTMVVMMVAVMIVAVMVLVMMVLFNTKAIISNLTSRFFLLIKPRLFSWVTGVTRLLKDPIPEVKGALIHIMTQNGNINAGIPKGDDFFTSNLSSSYH